MKSSYFNVEEKFEQIKDIDYVDIVKELDLRESDTLLIVSDVKNLALHEMRAGRKFDAQKFINSFKEQLPNGTLLFHAFNDNLVSGDVFDYKNSKPNTGSLSVTAWKDPEFVRTIDPFHSFMVWGEGAEKLKKLNDVSTFGKNSVFAWLHYTRAKLLIIDLPLAKSFTYVHYCEEKLRVKYRKHKKHRIRYIDENGKKSVVKKRFFTRKCGYRNYLDDLEKSMWDEGISQYFLFNKSKFMLIELNSTYNLLRSEIYPRGLLKLYKFSFKFWVKDVLKKMLFMR